MNINQGPQLEAYWYKLLAKRDKLELDELKFMAKERDWESVDWIKYQKTLTSFQKSIEETTKKMNDTLRKEMILLSLTCI